LKREATFQRDTMVYRRRQAGEIRWRRDCRRLLDDNISDQPPSRQRSAQSLVLSTLVATVLEQPPARSLPRLIGEEHPMRLSCADAGH
jgi:hypothetical protein